MSHKNKKNPIWGTFLFNELTDDYTVSLPSYFADSTKLPDDCGAEALYYYNWAKDSLPPCDWDFLRLEKGGILTIKRGYRWDGATNGITDRVPNHRSSLLHDALYDLMRMYYLVPDVYELGDPSEADNQGDHNREMTDMIYYMISIEDGDTREVAESDYFWIRSAGWIGTTFNEYQLKPWKFHASELRAFNIDNYILLEWQKNDQYMQNPDPVISEGYFIMRNGICIDTIDGILTSYPDYSVDANFFYSYQLLPVSGGDQKYDWSNVEYIASVNQEKNLILDGENDCFKSLTVCNDLYSDTIQALNPTACQLLFSIKFKPQLQTGKSSILTFYDLNDKNLIEIVYDGDQESLIYTDLTAGDIEISENVPADQWHTLGVMYDSLNQLTFVFDSVFISSHFTETRPTRGSTLVLGYNSGTNKNHGHFKGSIDELVLWKKAFTGELMPYLAGSQLSGMEKELIGLWKFQEPEDHFSVYYRGNVISDEIKRAYDESRYGNDAILFGFSDNTSITESIYPYNKLTIRNFPNPFTSNTTIKYYLSESSTVILRIIHQDGTIINQNVTTQDAGMHTFTINLSGLPAGIYYCQVQTETSVGLIRLLLR